jgi:hypothetical protein
MLFERCLMNRQSFFSIIMQYLTLEAVAGNCFYTCRLPSVWSLENHM